MKSLSQIGRMGLLAMLGTALLAIPYSVEAGPKTKKEKGLLDDLRYVAGDETGNEVKALKTELLVSHAENKAIAQVQRLIRKHKGTALEADLYFRLAELYMRKSKTDRFFEIHRQSETVVRLAPRLVQNASSRKTIEEAINAYEVIQKKFPNFNQIDLAIFNNAFARQGLGQDKPAELLYWELISKHPNSPLVPDCHLAIGEINFDRSNFKFALAHFRAIRKFPDSKVYPYGLYKSAWALYNMHDGEAALKALEEVVDYGQYVAKNKIESRLDLRKEALADMTIFYEDVYPAAKAFKYFQGQAGELDVGPTILRLAKIYDRHSRFRDMQVVLEDFIKYLPESPSIASIHNELAWNFDNQKERDKAVGQMEVLAQLCDANSEWMKSQKAPANVDPNQFRNDQYKACRDMLDETTLKLAGKWLKIYKKSPKGGAEYADSAEKAFHVYLSRNPTGKEAGEARYAYAELLFQREKFREASVEYAKVSGQSVGNELSHDANYAALLSLEKAVKEKWSDADENSFHALAKTYVEKSPKGKYRVDIEFKMAMIAYEKERYVEAAPIFMRLGRDFPQSEKGQKSQDLYLDILNVKKDYKGLREYSHGLLAREANPERKTRLSKIHEQAYFLEIQGFEDAKNWAAAIGGYQAFIKENPESELIEKALWNSMNLRFKVNDQFAGAKAAEEFYDRFPTSKEGVNSLLKAAQTYESMAQLDDAANVLQKLVKADPSNASKWQTLAADFYMLGGRWLHAKKYYTEMASKGDGKTRQHALEKLAYVEKIRGTASDQEAVQRQIVAAGIEPQASIAKVKEVEMAYGSGRKEEAFSLARKVVGSNATNEAQARARLIQARILEDEFMAQSVKARAERIAMVLGMKTEKLDKAQKAYQSAIKYGDARVTVESLRRLAGCYRAYVKALKEMPVPGGLSKEESEQFKEELSRLSIPLEEKGVESLAQAYEAARKAKLRDGTIADLKKELNEVNMQSQESLELGLEVPEAAVPTFGGTGS